MTHRVTKGVLETPILRVDGEVAGVIGSTPEKTWPHIQAYKYPKIAEQLSCKFLGCGAQSRVAWTLQDHSKFLQTVKYDVDGFARGLEDDTVQTLETYAGFIDTSTITSLNRQGVDGSYELIIGDEIELGYHDNYAS